MPCKRCNIPFDKEPTKEFLCQRCAERLRLLIGDLRYLLTEVLDAKSIR